jgi:hypothetical protein
LRTGFLASVTALSLSVGFSSFISFEVAKGFGLRFYFLIALPFLPILTSPLGVLTNFSSSFVSPPTT